MRKIKLLYKVTFKGQGAVPHFCDAVTIFELLTRLPIDEVQSISRVPIIEVVATLFARLAHSEDSERFNAYISLLRLTFPPNSAQYLSLSRFNSPTTLVSHIRQMTEADLQWFYRKHVIFKSGAPLLTP